MSWYVYLALCKDKSLYTGITKNPERREFEHNNDNIKGAKALRSKRPVRIVYTEKYKTQSKARKREMAIKKWKKVNKLKLISKR